MEKTFIPKGYKSTLDLWQTEQGIKFIKDTFQTELSAGLHLRRITAPLMVKSGTGINDNLNGVENPVVFPLKSMEGSQVEIVQSLAKWKRLALYTHKFMEGTGIYTDMNAIRPDEVTDNLHSVYVDQWDWEKVMLVSQRNTKYLHDTVRSIYSALKRTEYLVSERFPELPSFLPEDISFFHSQELLDMYPDLTPGEREKKACEKFGAIFVQGIGGKLTDGTIHDGRSPDYDDWSTTCDEEHGYKGLNGDIIVWNPVLKRQFELSSMGIRVSPASLALQLEIRGCCERRKLYFHKMLLSGALPQSIGGGIGQSRLCMLLLRKCHIGEVQSAPWSDEIRKGCSEEGVFLM
ncbi:MAG: aspartate--ammonia ligase [Bacteroidales bacterium]|jgi:aspartate--ammonia ligase|nr:aspartate--ammonia ligase [Bacteroidales bacterium]MCI2121130.1 aspartate--ammonia ligase [Bacteroidales bacterium]MCI2144720.1 aspartate--ammonia ligase [Bacteroidales bacterium]